MTFFACGGTRLRLLRLGCEAAREGYQRAMIKTPTHLKSIAHKPKIATFENNPNHHIRKTTKQVLIESSFVDQFYGI